MPRFTKLQYAATISYSDTLLVPRHMEGTGSSGLFYSETLGKLHHVFRAYALHHLRGNGIYRTSHSLAQVHAFSASACTVGVVGAPRSAGYFDGWRYIEQLETR